jgi:hypothetical protein
MRTSLRWTVAVTLAALTLTACSTDLPILEDLPAIPGIGDATDGSTDGPTDPDAPGDGGGDAGGDPGSDPGDDPDATEGSGDPGGSGDPPPATSSPQPPPAQLTPVNDAGPVGANGRAILRGDRPSLVIEIDVQEGARVDDAAVQHTIDTLRQVTDKATIRLGGGTTFSSDRRSWSTADVRNAAAAHRSSSTTDSEVSIHVLYLRGGHVDGNGNQTNAIGIAYSASTIALFPDRWSDLTGALLSSRAVERAVFLHEVGHLLGLVNLTYTSDIDHEDPDHRGHSKHRDSVMYYAVETTLIGQVFTGPPPDRFHADDLADLEGLRTGRY